MKNKFKSILILVSLLGMFAQPVLATEKATEVSKAPVSQEFLGWLFGKTKEYTGKVEEAIPAVVDATMKESKEVVKGFLLWRAFKHGMNAFGLFVIIGVIVYGIYRLGKTIIKEDSGENFGVLLACFITGLFIIVPTGLRFIENFYNFIQVLLAPRVYLIEQLYTFVNK